MNKLILFGFAFLLFPLNNIFGVTQTNLGDDIFVFVQTIIRNSDGTLVVYLESTKFSDINKPALGILLDHEASRQNNSVITIDGQQYQIVRRVQSQSFDSEGLVASTVLSYNMDGKSIPLARFAHDGYVTISGDTMQSMWTFIRPVS